MLAKRKFVVLQLLVLAPAIMAMFFVHGAMELFDRTVDRESRQWGPLARDLDPLEDMIGEVDFLSHKGLHDPASTTPQFAALSRRIDLQLDTLAKRASGGLSDRFMRNISLLRASWSATHRLVLAGLSADGQTDLMQLEPAEIELQRQLENIREIHRRMLDDIDMAAGSEAAESATTLRIAGSGLVALCAAVGLGALVVGLRDLRATRLRLRRARNKLDSLIAPEHPDHIETGGQDQIALVEQAVSKLETLIEEKEQLSHELGRIASEWRESFDSVGSPMLVVEADGRICRLNSAARELSGSDFSALIGTMIGSVAEGEPWLTADALNRSLFDAASPHAASTVRTSDRAWEIDIYRGKERRVLIFNDRTAVEQLQERLKRAELMSALGALVGGVAHEVRNPLFSLTAALDALESEDELEPVFPEYLERLRADLLRLSDLMKDLMEFGRPRVRSNSEVDLTDLVARVAKGLPENLGRSDVRVELDPQEWKPDLQVTGNAGDLELAIRNVIDNAIRHSPRGGVVHVRLSGNEGMAKVSVADEGGGFRPDELTKVFEPFYSNRKGGTGIGLAMVKQIIEVHSGKAIARNAGVCGGIVDLTLPTLVTRTDQ
jgi:signal transduction histidine kinase